MSMLPAIPDDSMMGMLPESSGFGPLDENAMTQEDIMEQMMFMQMIQEATDSVVGQAPAVDMLPDTYDDALMRLIDSVPLE